MARPASKSRNRLSLVLDMASPSSRSWERERSRSSKTLDSHRSPLSSAYSQVNNTESTATVSSPRTPSSSASPHDRRWSGIFSGGEQNAKRYAVDDTAPPIRRLRSLLSPRPSLRRAAVTAPGSPTYPKSPTSSAAPPIAFSPFEIYIPPSPGMATIDESASVTSGALSTVPSAHRSTDALLASATATTRTVSPSLPPSISSPVSEAPPTPATIPPPSPSVMSEFPPSPMDDGASIISTLPRVPDPIALQQIRLAKLARTLGEDIPAELVVPQAPSTPAPAAASTSAPPPPRPRRLQRPHPNRRLSLDMTALLPRIPSGSVPSASPSKDQVGQSSRELKRSRSMWVRKALNNTNGAHAHLENGPLDTELSHQGSDTSSALQPLTERQRVANVRRARKMNELFGSEPPPALFQITAPAPEPPSPAPSTHGASFATFMSTSDANGLLSPVREKHASLLTTSDAGTSVLTISDGKRTSVITVLSVSSSGEHDQKLVRRHSVDVPANTEPSAPAVTSPAATSTVESVAATSVPFTSPPSPPPFANVHMAPIAPSPSPTPTPTPTPRLLVRSSTLSAPRARTDSSGPSVAWRRRKQAAKLAHFFGVESRDIEPTFSDVRHNHPIPALPAPVAAPATLPRAHSPTPPVVVVRSFAQPPPSAEMLVDVRVRAPARLWGVRETDNMHEAITRLRELRAS